MNRSRTPSNLRPALAAFTLAAAAALASPALGQGALYNRSIDPADISFVHSPDGLSSQITVEVRFTTLLEVPADLSLYVTVAVNGTVLPGGGGAGGGITQRIIWGLPNGNGPFPGSLDCTLFCQLHCFFTVNGSRILGGCAPWTGASLCFCSVPEDINVPATPCRMILTGPQLSPGDIISVSLAAMTDAEPGGAGPVLPELDTTDDFASVVVTAPQCPADFDANGSREVPDIFAFLSAWFAQDPAADFNGDSAISVPDIFSFLSAWFAGCP